jgi:glycosyltransferase involved in cell wall biosynthesis
LKVALVHDWLTGMRGGEAVLEAISELFPNAPLYSLIAFPEKLSPALKSREIHTSWMQRLPFVETRYRHYLPLMPFAIESLDLSEYDLIVSSSHCVAKGIRKRPDAVHVCYLHAPMRYMWERFDDYFNPQKAGWLTRWVAAVLRPWLQSWDVRSSRSVDLLISNSRFIGEQARRHYGLQFEVLHPFAQLERFLSRERRPENFYLMVGAFAPYKRVDLAIEAFNELGLPLWIVGGGQDEEKLRRMARPNVRFLGSLENEAVGDLYSRCRAFVFPGVEDFGITPLEAMASGAPVIALAEGGALETVTSETGVFFDRQTVESIKQAVQRTEGPEWLAGQLDRAMACRERARLFSRERFVRELNRLIKSRLS